MPSPPDRDRWKTACGLTLDKAARKETTLTETADLVTCRACKNAQED